MVFDESHKLIDAARQMYSTVWDEQDAEFIVGLSGVNRRTTGMDELTVLRSQLAEYNRQIFDRLAGDLAGNHTREGSRIEIVIGSMEKIYIGHMAKALEQLPLSYQENSGQKMRMQGLKKALSGADGQADRISKQRKIHLLDGKEGERQACPVCGSNGTGTDFIP